MLYNRINIEDYEESQEDIQAVSRIAEDIRDALLDYQVCSNEPYVTWVQLMGRFGRWHSSKRYMTRTAN